MIKLTKLFSLADIIRQLPPNQKLPEEDESDDWIEENETAKQDSDSWSVPSSSEGEGECEDSYSYSSSYSPNPSSYREQQQHERVSLESTSPWRRPSRYSPSYNCVYTNDMPEDDPASPIRVLTTKPRPIPGASGTPMSSYGSSGTPIRSASSLRMESSSVTEGPIRRLSGNPTAAGGSSGNMPPSSQSVDITTPTTPTIISANITGKNESEININSSQGPQITFSSSSPKDLSTLISPRGDELLGVLPILHTRVTSTSSSLSMTSGIASESQMSRHNQSLSYSLSQSHRIRGPSSGISFGESAAAAQSITPMRNSYQQQQQYLRSEIGGSFSSDSEDGGIDNVMLRGYGSSGSGGAGRRVRMVKKPENHFKVSIVGSDYENGIVYVAVMHMEKTFLNSLSMKSRQLTPLYTWNEPLDIVWVTTNSLFKVVGVTVVRHISKLYTSAQRTSSGNAPAQPFSSCYYETFIQCFDESKKHYIGEKTANAQKMQFVFDVGVQGPPVSSSLSVMSYFLHTISSHSVTLYTVVSRRKSSQTALYSISNSPTKARVVCNEFLWSKYVESTKVFHCLFVVNDKKSGKGVRCRYKSVFLGSSQPRVLSDHVFSLCFTLTMRFNTFDECLPLPYVLRDSSRQHRRPIPRRAALPSITLVTLESGVSCLCIQHEAADNSVPISVIDLDLKTRIDFSIPVSQFEQDIKSLRVLFVAFYDYLLIYIPGVYLHMLDVSSKHNPGAGLIFTKSNSNTDNDDDERTAPLPSPSKDVFPAVGALSFKGFSRHRMIVDTRTGEVIEYGINSEGISKLVDERYMDSSFLCKIVHAARLHFRDDALVSDAITKMLKEHPRQTTVELLKEYVLGETYYKLRDELPPELIQGVPPTTTDQSNFLAEGLKECEHLRDVSVVPMTSPRGRRAFEGVHPYSSISLWWKSVRDRYISRMNEFSGNAQTRRTVAPVQQTSSASPRLQQIDDLKLKSVVLNKKTQYLKIFRDADGNTLGDTLVKTPSGDHIDNVILRMVKGIIKHYFLQTGQKMNPATAQGYAERAHETRAEVIDVLFANVVASLSDDGNNGGPKKPSLKQKRAAHARKMNMFVVLENLLNTIDELGGILYPSGFVKKFAYLGYECLSDLVFLQYVERGTIRITKDFVWTLYMRNVHVKKPKFFYRVVSRLPWYEMTEIVLSQPPPPMFMVDHCFSKNYKALTYDRVELSDNSSMFVPLTQILRTLKTCSDETRLLLLPARKKYTPDVIENQMEISMLLKIIDGLSHEYCIKFLDLDFKERTDNDRDDDKQV